MSKKEKLTAWIAYPTAIGLFAWGVYLIAKGNALEGLGLIGAGVWAGFAGMCATHPNNRNQ